ncbi:unnamed protein product, partial [Linum tenue]
WFCRGAVDRGGTQVVSGGVAESRERRLERDFQEFRQDQDADAGGQSRSEVLPPQEQSQSPATPLQSLRHHYRQHCKHSCCYNLHI